MAPKKESTKSESGSVTKASDVKVDKADKVVKAEKKDAKDVTSSENSKPKKPEKKDYEDKINDITAQINKKKDEIADIVKKIDEKNSSVEAAEAAKTGGAKDAGASSKESYENQRKALFDQLTDIKAEKGTLLEQKKQLFSQEKQEKDKKRDMQKQLNTMSKDKLLCNEDEIDNEIRKLELSISMGTLENLKAEKKVIQQISLMKKKKPEAKAHGQMMAKLEADTKATDSPSATTRKTSLEGITGQLDSLSEKQSEISKKLDKLKEEKTARQGLVKPLIEARSKLRQDVTDLMDKKQEVINARKEAFNKWKVFEDTQKKERQQKWEEEQSKWVAEQEARNAERELSAPCPHMDHVIVLSQTIDYCKSLLPQQQQAKAIEKEIIHDLPKGTQVMKTKKDRNETMFCDATKGKRGKKGNRILAINEDEDHHEQVIKKKEKQSIKHTAESLTVFKSLALPTPMIVSDLPDTIARLQVKLDQANSEVKTWEEERKMKIAEAKSKAEVAVSPTEVKEKETAKAE